MTVKDLVSTHTRVKNPHENVDVFISLHQEQEPAEIGIQLTPQEVCSGCYADKIVCDWFQTSEFSGKYIIIEINILVRS